MKKICNLLTIVCSFSALSAQTIIFPDANLKARLLSAAIGNGIAYHNGNSFKIDANDDGEIQVSEASQVTVLVLHNCGISDLSGLQYFVNLTHLNCANNTISSLDLTPFPNLVGFDAYNNNLTNLDVANLPQLTNFSCNNNQLTSLTVSNLNSLHSIHCVQNQLPALDVSGLNNLIQLNCRNNQLETLDLTAQNYLSILNCSNNNLTSLYIKNDSYEPSELDFSGNPMLQYVCADDFQLTNIQDKISQYGYSNCFANSYCSYVQGQSFYAISGTIQYDEANDGCDLSDIAYPSLKLSFSNGTHSGTAFGDTDGNYGYNVQNGTHTIQPILDNPNYFDVAPASATVTFPAQTSPYVQNFCITPNGPHPDLEISVLQIDTEYAALPGGNNTYRITYKNKGTHTQSGAITFNFDDAIMDYGTANPPISSQQTGVLSWNFSNLRPFESRAISITLHFNSNTDLPPVNEGDPITFTTSIDTASPDDTPNDNTFAFTQFASSIILLGTPDHAAAKDVMIYPNPVKSVLNIETSDSIKKESIKVYDNTGRLVIDVAKAEVISSVDVGKLSAGNYFMVIQTNRGSHKSKFVKN